MNCSTENQIYSRHILKTEEETHHKVDPKEERIRRVEARAASEPFRTKRHPAVIEKGKKDQRFWSSLSPPSGTRDFVTQFCSPPKKKRNKQ